MEVIIGIISAFFFATTFVLNEQMAGAGGHWFWAASLRFLFMVPLMALLMKLMGYSFSKIFRSVSKEWKTWWIYSQVGFVIFYLPLCFGSSFAPGWLVASTWQLSIICGTLLIPFIREDDRHRIDPREFIYFAIILLGIFLIESVNVKTVGMKSVLLGIVSVLIACISYPLGNRKIILVNTRHDNLNGVERTFAMGVMTFPTWCILSLFATPIIGLPQKNQLISGLIVAVCSGIIATTLFFMATQMVSHNMRKLASVEATSSFEVVFSLLLGMVVLGSSFPTKVELLGILFVVVGVILKSMATGYLAERVTPIKQPLE